MHCIPKVEPNVHKVQEHRRKYEKLRKERDLKKAEREEQKRKAEAVSSVELILLISEIYFFPEAI